MKWLQFPYVEGSRWPHRHLMVGGKHRLHHGLWALLLVVHDVRDWKHWIPDLLGKRK